MFRGKNNTESDHNLNSSKTLSSKHKDKIAVWMSFHSQFSIDKSSLQMTSDCA